MSDLRLDDASQPILADPLLEEFLEEAIADAVADEMVERQQAKTLRQWFESEFLGHALTKWYEAECRGPNAGEVSEEELVRLAVAPAIFYAATVEIGEKALGDKVLALVDDIESTLRMPALLAVRLFANKGVAHAR